MYVDAVEDFIAADSYSDVKFPYNTASREHTFYAVVKEHFPFIEKDKKAAAINDSD